jgi:hypothetical protein
LPFGCIVIHRRGWGMSRGTTKTAVTLGTDGVHRAIAKRYTVRGNGDAPRYIVAHEVRNATGFNSNGAADALVLKCWPSDGIGFLGFEVKTARSDWLRELKDPTKAEAFSKYCDEWWIAAGSADVVKLEEVPPGWGLLVPTPNGELRAVRNALKAVPLAPSLALVASFIRGAQMRFERDEVGKRVENERASWLRQGEYQREAAERRADESAKIIRSFEERSGLRMAEYNGDRIADAVRVLMDLRADPTAFSSIGGRLTSSAKQMRQLADQAEKAATEFAAIIAIQRADP